MPTNCPDDLTLLSFAIGATDDPRVDAQIAAHIQRCAPCHSEVGRHRALAADVRRAMRDVRDVGGECLDEMTIAALAEGVETDDSRAAAMAHLVTCASCRSQLTELRAALNDAEMTDALPRPGTTRRLRSTITRVSAAGLAAAAALVFTIGRNWTQRETAAPMRDETGALVVAPLAVSPVDMVSGTLVFRWSAVPRANRYRVRVFKPDGVVVWETLTSDTTAVPPSPMILQRGTHYLWKVEARTDFDRWVGSALTEFQLSTDGVRP